MAGGQSEFTVRSNGTSLVIHIPKKYWGLQNGQKYRMVVWPASAPENFLPYSCNTSIGPRAKDRCYIVVPSVFGFSVGDRIIVWVGDLEDWGNEALPHGRGRTQEEREADLERAEGLLFGHSGE